MTIACKDCRHLLTFKEAWHSPRCALARYVNNVTGETLRRYAEVERNFDVAERCGPEGRHFAPREAVADVA